VPKPPNLMHWGIDARDDLDRYLCVPKCGYRGPASFQLCDAGGFLELAKREAEALGTPGQRYDAVCATCHELARDECNTMRRIADETIVFRRALAPMSVEERTRLATALRTIADALEGKSNGRL
jgi:hypothetical protein